MRAHSKALTLSIVIPAYNDERQLKNCLNAISIQDVMPDEVIIVDNNSTDNTSSLVKKYSFAKIIKESRQGKVYARDKGFNSAKSDIIGRIDTDSIIPKNWVAHVKEFYAGSDHHKQAWTGGCYVYNLRFPRLAGLIMSVIAFRMNRLLMGHYILYGSNMAIPNKMWKDVRSQVCRNNGIHEDLDLSIHLHQAGYQINYQQYVKVGVEFRRVLRNRNELWENLMMWPNTLKVHGKKTWVFGWVGALILYVLSPFLVFNEWVARLFGRDPLDEY